MRTNAGRAARGTGTIHLPIVQHTDTRAAGLARFTETSDQQRNQKTGLGFRCNATNLQENTG
jgi:hypothetical protein